MILGKIGTEHFHIRGSKKFPQPNESGGGVGFSEYTTKNFHFFYVAPYINAIIGRYYLYILSLFELVVKTLVYCIEIITDI